MASHTIPGQVWPEGTTVGVYPAGAWVNASRAPSGQAVATGSVSGGAVTWSGLAESVRYVAYGAGKGVTFLVKVDRRPDLSGERAPDRQRLRELEEYAVDLRGGTPVSVTEFGGEPGSSSDVMEAIRSASAHLGEAGTTQGGIIYLPPGEYTASTLLDLNEAQNVIIRGAGSNSASQSTRVTWTGAAGSGPMVRCHASDGLKLEGLKLVYSDATYDGDLIQCGSIDNVPATNLVVRDCWIGGSASRTAASLLNLNGCVGATIENNSFYNAAHLIIGSTTDFANTINVRGNIFNFAANSSIRNPGESWMIEGNSFEALFGGTAGAISSAHDGAWPARGVTVASNWFGDVSTNSGTWIDMYGFGLAFQTNVFDNRGMTSVVSISLHQSEGVAVIGNTFRNGAKGVDIAGGSGYGWVISGNHFDSVTTPVPTVAGMLGLNCQGNSGVNGYIELIESGDFPAPTTNCARLYAKDNGSGKTQIVARFSSGAVQVLATEP